MSELRDIAIPFSVVGVVSVIMSELRDLAIPFSVVSVCVFLKETFYSGVY